MFDFEKFPVYLRSEEVYGKVLKSILPKVTDKNIKDQLRRASLSIVLNIAEGAGKYSKADKKNFYIIARGSVHECVAVIRLLKLEGVIDEDLFTEIYNGFEEISKMLSGLITSLVKL